jgi:hypothetical protein
VATHLVVHIRVSPGVILLAQQPLAELHANARPCGGKPDTQRAATCHKAALSLGPMAPPGSLGTGLGLHISQMAKGHGVKKSLEFTQLIKAIGACALGSARTGFSGIATVSLLHTRGAQLVQASARRRWKKTP